MTKAVSNTSGDTNLETTVTTVATCAAFVPDCHDPSCHQSSHSACVENRLHLLSATATNRTGIVGQAHVIQLVSSINGRRQDFAVVDDIEHLILRPLMHVVFVDRRKLMV